MTWRVEIKEKEGVFDALGEGIQKDILDLGLNTIRRVRVTQVYTITGDIPQDQIRKISEELLVDRITQEYKYSNGRMKQNPPPDNAEVIEIAYNPGVMDPVEESTVKGIRDMGIERIQAVHTARQYHLYGNPSRQDLDLVIDKVLSNKLIQHVVRHEAAGKQAKKASRDAGTAETNVVSVDLLNATDKALSRLSRDGQLFLNLDEMKAIRKYFRKLKRNPTDCELETVAQTWSEHCYHKTFRGNIRYQYTENGKKKTTLIRNLLKSTIVKATKKLNKPWCVSVFHDNAGVIKFDEDFHVCFKVETHNHPSALEPFGGANTGIGGVIRDILGTGLGAKPVCNTDIFCFAPPDFSFKQLPPGTLHPKRIMKGVVSGVRDYGNKMGIPTVNGAIIFDERFIGNPLVYCGNIGLIPKGKEKKKVYKGDMIVVAGGKTGRDGIHGATFSSGELTSESEVVSSGAVQIGDPIQEKKVLDVLLQARDQDLYSAITDCGAGGLSSAVGEMGQKVGARVDLEKVPLKYQGLSYDEIWISESQERMVLSVNPKKVKRLLKVFAEENVEATVIGEFTGSGRLELFYKGARVCDLDMEFLHEGNPRITKNARWAPALTTPAGRAGAGRQPKNTDPKFSCPEDLTAELSGVLSHYNVCSKEWVIRQYDHEVQGGSVIKPLAGVNCDGPSDAAVVTPKLGSTKGIAVSNGINVRFGMIDPFWMAASCIDEAIRQIIAVGGDLKKIALLDNFCWGSPDKPQRLGALVRAAQACLKTAVGYGTPFISGKDSLYNEYVEGGKSIAIPETLLISAIGIVDDVRKCVSMDLKAKGNLLYVVGETRNELGGSIYYAVHDALGQNVPTVDMRKSVKIFAALSRAVRKGLVRSMHDCSEGGIGAALAEMAFSGGLGVTAHLDKVPYKGKPSSRRGEKRNDFLLFSESNSRFIVEVAPKDRAAFEKILKEISFGCFGCVEPTPQFIVYGLNNRVCVNADIKGLKEAWQKPLRW